MQPLSPYKVFFPGEWDLIRSQVQERVWKGRGMPLTQVPAHLIDPVSKSLKSLDLIEFRNSSKSLMKKLEEKCWEAPMRKTRDERQREANAPPTLKMRKRVSISDRNPTLGENCGNANYYDFRNTNVKGANALYGEGEQRPLDDEERRRAGLIPAAVDKLKGRSGVQKQVPEHPAPGVLVSDTWSHQGVSWHGFMIGGRYNRFDCYDELLFREYGIFLPRGKHGMVYFTEQPELDDETTEGGVPSSSSGIIHIIGDHATRSSSTSEPRAGESDSVSSASSSSSAGLHFKVPSLSTSTEPISSQRPSRQTRMDDAMNSTASSAYYKSNVNSVKAMMERLAGTVTTPRRSYGNNNYQAPRSFVKGGRGGRSFSFSFRPRQTGEQRNSQEIEQLISLGHQLATSHGGHDE